MDLFSQPEQTLFQELIFHLSGSCLLYFQGPVMSHNNVKLQATEYNLAQSTLERFVSTLLI